MCIPIPSMIGLRFVSLASAIAGACAWALARLLHAPLARGLVAGGVFSVVFLVAAWGARSEELEHILSGVRRRLGRARAA